MTRFVVVPQWQGSPSSRAMQFIDGAEAIAGDLPRSATTRVDVPVEAGEALGTGIHRFSALTRIAEAIRAALTDAGADQPAVVVGGDCGVAVPAIAQAAAQHPGLAVVWLDAHADLNSPASSPSGAFAGMALRAVVDELALPGSGAVPGERIVLAGAREFDDAEAAVIAERGLRTLTVDDLGSPGALADAVAATGASAVYVHVDLDVLDPAVITGLALPLPFGLALSQLTDAIGALRARLPLAGASISGFAPSSPAAAVDDLGTILRVVGALA
ncbi:arginase family protein [Microbacterium sp.]|uniref:arginase family protein n=1 Tax=Microbacterium sp. TaxID=51671 RepID=UPI0039E393F6